MSLNFKKFKNFRKIVPGKRNETRKVMTQLKVTTSLKVVILLAYK